MPSMKISTDAKPSFRARGERHGNARLTAQQVRAIRRDRAAHDTAFSVLAERYGVSVSTVGRAASRDLECPRVRARADPERTGVERSRSRSS